MKQFILIGAFLISFSTYSQNDTIYPPDTLLTPAMVAKFNATDILSNWTLGFCAIEINGSDTTFSPCYHVTYEDHYNTSIQLCPDNLDEVGGMGLHLGDPVLLDSSTFYQMELDGSNIINDTNYYWINYKNLTQGIEIDGGGPGHDYCIEADLFLGTTNTWYQSFNVLLGPIDIAGPFSIPYTTAGKIGILKEGVLLEHTPPSSESTVALTGGIIPIDYCGWHPEPAGFGHFHAAPTGINLALYNDGIDTMQYKCSDIPQENHEGLVGFTFEGVPIYGPLEGGVAPSNLDACSGHTGMTPDYPGAVYHYHLSATEIINNPPCRWNEMPIDEFEYGEWTGASSPPAQPGAISGLTSVCENQSGVVYTISDVTGASTYNWTVPTGATIVSGDGTTSITIDFGTSSGNICVNAQNTSGTSADQCLAIAATSCGTAPTTPGAISGLTTVCDGDSAIVYSISDVMGADTYNWTVPSSATILSGQGTTSILVEFGSTSGNICVNAQNSFGISSDQCEAITVNICVGTPSTPGPITGLTTVCENQPGVNYSIQDVPNADTYNWTVPAGATIMAGQGTISIMVDWGMASGNVCVNAENVTGTSADQCEPVTVNSCGMPPMPPGPISGLTSVCENQNGLTYSISDVTGATTYNWTVPLGATIVSGQGTASIVVDWGTTSGNVCVDAENGFGTSPPSCQMVTSSSCGTAPNDPGDISGLDTVCLNQPDLIFSIADVTGADFYNWTVPPGATITAGDSTTSITVTFGTNSGYVCVNAENTSGVSSDTCFYVEAIQCGSVPPKPAPIMGLDTVCANQTGLTYGVPPTQGASNYVWTVPSGATIVSGQGTNQITVDWGSAAGDICVYAENNFGSGNPRCLSVVLCDDSGLDYSENPNLLSLYPNPTSNVLTVLGEYDYFTIHTADGALVMSSTEPSQSETTIIDLTEVPTGVYFFTAERNGQVYFEKLIIK